MHHSPNHAPQNLAKPTCRRVLPCPVQQQQLQLWCWSQPHTQAQQSEWEGREVVSHEKEFRQDFPTGSKSIPEDLYHFLKVGKAAFGRVVQGAFAPGALEKAELFARDIGEVPVFFPEKMHVIQLWFKAVGRSEVPKGVGGGELDAELLFGGPTVVCVVC